MEADVTSTRGPGQPGPGHVLIVSTTDLAVPTASSIHLLSIARALKALGKTVEIFARAGCDHAPDLAIRCCEAVVGTDRGVRKLYNAFLQLVFFVNACRELRKVDHDLIYIRVSSITLPFTLVARMVLHGPVVTEHNGWIADEGELLGLPRWQRWLQRRMQLWDAGASHLVRVVTTGLKRVLVENGVPWDKIVVIGNGTDTRHFHPVDKSEACARMGLDPRRPTVGFIGNLAPWQGVDRLIDAMPHLLARFPDLQAVIGGGGMLLDDLKARARALGVLEATHFMGWVPYAQANDLICCCDVAVAPFIEARNSRIGLSPQKIRDFAAAGRPAVASEIPGITELSGDGILITCNTAHAESFAQAIGDLLDDPGRRAAMARHARRHAQAVFDWREIGGQLLAASAGPPGRARPLVVHIISGLQTGGAERMLTNYLTSDRSPDIDHLVISLTGAGGFAAQIVAGGTPVVEVGMSRSILGLILGVRSLRRMLKALDPDIVDGWMYHGAVFGFAGTFGRRGRPGRRRFIHIRCTVMDLSKYSRTLRVSYALCRRLTRRADRVIYNSNAGLVEHGRDGFCNARAIVIQNGVSPDIFRADLQRRDALRAEWGIPAGRPAVCTVARYDPMKGYDILIEAADRLADRCHFVVAGLDTDQRLPARPNLTRLGLRRDVPQLLSACDIYCLTSTFGEGFPNALAEAMSVGLTPVAFDVGDSREIIGATGIVARAKDAASLVAAIEQAIALRKGAGAIDDTPPRRRVVEYFNLREAVGKFDTLYRS